MDVSRRDLLGAATALSLLGPQIAKAGAARAPAASPGSTRPNLILFFPDEVRADALSCYGNPVCKTPNLDRLARSGARFENCHVQFPVCGASRCSLLTGWPASVHGHRSLSYFLRPDEPNMFRYLKEAGYDVFWFGKNDALAQASFPGSVTEWKDAMPPFTPAMLNALKTMMQRSLTPGIDTMLFPAVGTPETASDHQNVKWAVEILERREADRPFCIFLPLFNPHPPYMAPEGFQDMYKAGDVPPLIPPDLPKRPAFHADIRKYYGLVNATDKDLRKVRAVYYGKVSYVDWLLGILMEAMERTGHAKDTALIVSSDHGDYAGDYGLVEKWASGQEDCLTHVPLLASVPGGKAGIVDRDMVELYDIMATMLELGGTKAAHTNFARSLVPQLRGERGQPRSAAFTEGGYNMTEQQAFDPGLPGLYGPKGRLEHERPQDVSRCASVRTASHKYVARPNGRSELYDARHDPDLRNNLIDDRSHAAVRGELQSQLMDWYIDTTGVPPLDKDPRGLPPFPPAAGVTPG